jgi:DNA-binding transcriptional ArsR family regulator
MKNYFEIETADQLKAIADPLRRRLLEIFASEPMTTKQAAGLLNEKPTRLYHHVDLLEKTGLIELIKTRQNRGTVERYYRSVAKKFAVGRDLVEVSSGAGDESSIENMLTAALENSSKKLRESADADLPVGTGTGRAIALASSEVYLDDEAVNELADVVQKWFEKNEGSKKKKGARHHFMMVVFPVPEDH